MPQLLLSFIPNFDPNVGLIKTTLISLTYLVWIFMLGRSLNACLPKRRRLNEVPQLIALFLCVIIYIPIVMLSDIGIYFYGIAVFIPIVMLLCFIYLFYFAAKALTSIERGTRTSFGDHISEMIQLLFAWIGVWFFQSRLNKIYQENKSIFEEE